MTPAEYPRLLYVPRKDAGLVDLPDDSESLRAMVGSLLEERDGQRQRADELHVENLRLQLELERYRKWYYGPRADRLQSSGDLAQLLLNFAEEMDRKPVNPDDLPPRPNRKKNFDA